VHDKAFAWRVAREGGLVPAPLRDVIAVLEPEALCAPDAARAVEAIVAAWPAWAQRSFVLKPRFGTSARGRASGGAGRDVRWHGALARLAERGGALLEPWLERSWDASAQFFVREDGDVACLGTLLQTLTPAGAPRGHRGVVGADGEVASGLACDAALRDAALHVAREAARAGYRGPCGVDAFAYRDPETGAERVRPVVELNARFTVGTVAIGHVRRELAALRACGALPAQGAVAFELALDGSFDALPAAARRVALGPGGAAIAFRVQAP
jgi:hypothetical protein